MIKQILLSMRRNQKIAILLIFIISFMALLYIAEGDINSTKFMACVFMTMSATIFLISRRLYFSFLTAAGLISIATATSAVKLKLMGLSLQAFDVWFYLRDSAVVGFVLDRYLPAVIGVAGLSLAALGIGIAVFRAERPITEQRLLASAVIGLGLVGTTFAFPIRPSDPQGYFFSRHLSSSFFVSLRDVARVAVDSDFTARFMPDGDQVGYDHDASCQAGPHPDIVVALMESAMPPSLYPEMKVPTDLDARFRDADGRLRSLQVETFGGATWVSTVGLFTGLPTIDFGWMRQYLTGWLTNRVHYSLARRLVECGYRTVVVSPLRYEFGHEGAFLTSLGIQDYRDRAAIGAASRHERDDIYFSAVRGLIEEHHARDPRPIFVFVMTMAAHNPYDERFAPEVQVAGEPFGNSPQVDEYLRRIVMQRDDLDRFLESVRRAPGPHGTLVLDFGDHQPVITRELAEKRSAEALADPRSIAYRTYYRLTAFGTGPATAGPAIDTLDIAYLGPLLQSAAGLPLGPVDREMMRLADICEGRFASCPDRSAIDQHLRRLVIGGMLDIPIAR